MVKNNTGGNKGKKVARKNATTSQEPKRNTEVRRVSNENEMYAVVTKIFSAKRCMATGTDGSEYSCNIRGKFLKGRRSGEGTIGIGVWVIIGFYEWEVKMSGSRGCDILEIYTSNERDILKQIEMHNVSSIILVGEAKEFNKDCTFSKFSQTTDIINDNNRAVSPQPLPDEALGDTDDVCFSDSSQSNSGHLNEDNPNELDLDWGESDKGYIPKPNTPIHMQSSTKTQEKIEATGKVIPLSLKI